MFSSSRKLFSISTFVLAIAYANANADSTKTPGLHADFVGSSTCRQCHQSEYQDWQKSDHFKAMQPANSDTVGNLLNIRKERIVNFKPLHRPRAANYRF